MQLHLLNKLKSHSPNESLNDSVSKSSDKVNEKLSIPYIADREKWFKWYGEEYLTSEHWANVQKHVRNRDKHRCRFCGCSGTRTNHLEVHHRDYEHIGRELDDDSCVVLLCKRCHRGLHKLIRK